jgi:hypothetical protein
VFNGSYGDRTSVLKAAKDAGHLKMDLKKQNEGVTEASSEDELNSRPGMWRGDAKRMTAKGKPTKDELGMQNNLKNRIKASNKKGGLTGPKGSLPEQNEEVEELEEAFIRTPGHIKKHLEDLYGPAQTTITGKDTVQHITRHLNDDGEDADEVRTHELIGKGKDSKVGKLIKHTKPPKEFFEEVEELDESSGYTLKHIKTTKHKTTDDEDNPIDASKKHYEIHHSGSKVGDLVHYNDDYAGNFYSGSLHGRKLPHERNNTMGKDDAHSYMKGVLSSKWHTNSKHAVKESLDERTLTAGETAEKEKIVHGMKKSLKGFKARYGNRAKEVMYATATKQAKKD